MGKGLSVMLPAVTEKEFCEHIEEDDFPIRYGNPVRIHTEDGRDLVCMTYELYERLTGDIVKMGYTTCFYGEVKFDRPVSKELASYINEFAKTRHVRMDVEVIKRIYPDWERLCWKKNLGNEGEYFIGKRIQVSRPYIDSEETFNSWIKQCKAANGILDDNYPPSGVPGLWCHWIINSDGNLCWSGAEKFYDYDLWLQYLIEHFFKPEGYILNGRIAYIGERGGDMGYLIVKDNQVRKEQGYITTFCQGSILCIEMPAQLNEDMETILHEKNGISLKTALEMYFQWIGQCPDEFERWVKEIREK